MKSSLKILLAVAGLAGSALIGTSALAAGTPLFVGDPGDEASVQRIITIAPDTKWVNVAQDETVKFVDANSGRSFVWRFDTPTWTAFDLSIVAPAGVLNGHHLTAYVAQSPDENNN